MKNRIKDLSISKSTAIREALKRMDSVGRKLLIVLDQDSKFYSLLSIGDIQRAIIKDIDINNPVSSILRENVRVAKQDDNLDSIKEQMKIRRNEFMPIISLEKDIIKVIFWEELFEHKLPKSNRICNLPVIIMAGGEGRRLRPLTSVIPKPLLPVGEKAVIELIMDRFVELGCNRFYVSLNYKADLIEYYLNSLRNDHYILDYFRESSPLGTAGSLHLLKDKIKETFFISNCDILIDQDLSEILDYHKSNNNEITIVAALKNFAIPYGVLTTCENGALTGIEEKPEITFKINTGLYILEPHLIEEIPEDTFFHITRLIESVSSRNGRVGVFPVNSGSWIDIGDWDEYLKSLQLV